MQRKIWDKASTDSAGLAKYYEAHKGKYWWNASADALLFTCNSAETAETLKARLTADPIGAVADVYRQHGGGYPGGLRPV